MALDFDSTHLKSPFYTEEHQAWREQLRRFVDTEIMPFVDDWEEAGEVPLELWPRAAAIGLLQMGYPEEYGGISEGIDIFFHIIASEELARCGAGGVAASLMIHSIGLPPLARFASEALKQAIIPPVMSGEQRIALAVTEPSGGSDLASLTTTARRDGDHYVVNGSKTFITGGMRADHFTTAVRTGGGGIGGISLLLIPASEEIMRDLAARQFGL